jgi:hypothetical protein
MRTIDELSLELAPVHLMRRPRTLFAVWVISSVAFYLGVVQRATQRDLVTLIRDGKAYPVAAGLLAVIFLHGAVQAYRHGLPGRAPSRWTTPLPWALLAAWAVAIALGACSYLNSYVVPLPTFLPEPGTCAREIAVTALGPAIALLMLLRYLAPMRSALAGATALLTCVAGAALCQEFHCVNRDILHLLGEHASVVAGMAALGAAAGRKLLRW